MANAGIRLQRDWRWNGRPLRVRITEIAFKSDGGQGYRIAWERWFPREKKWKEWRAYVGAGGLAEVICRYRDYADGWRGRDDGY